MLFYHFEKYEAGRGRTRLLQPRLFNDRGFVVGMVVTCIYFAGHTSMLLVLSGVPAADAGAAAGLASTMQQVANSVGIALVGAVVFSVIPKRPSPADYARGFLASTLINLGMLAIASLLIFRIPAERGRDPAPAAGTVLEA
jgi:membrane protease YdiL (CAAX protease family)